jgi:hypothetical protein
MGFIWKWSAVSLLFGIGCRINRAQANDSREDRPLAEVGRSDLHSDAPSRRLTMTSSLKRAEGYLTRITFGMN